MYIEESKTGVTVKQTANTKTRIFNLFSLQSTPNLEVPKVEVVRVRNSQLVASVAVGRTPGQSTSRANML